MSSDRTMGVLFFVGPSVARDEFVEACKSIPAEVQVRPPAQQGDLLRLHHCLPDVVGILDGFFFQQPSILHKEILWTMQRGVRVLGAASLGALRAAELNVFGMEGIGAIYKMYKAGRIEGDDEVAVLHADAADGWRPLSDPLVNIRWNLRLAVARRVVSARAASDVLASARSLHFTQRTFDAALHLARRHGTRAEPRELDALRDFLRREAVDLKRQDALALVQVVADRIREPRSWPRPDVGHVNHTIYLHLFQRQYIGYEIEGQYVLEASALAFQKLLSPAFPALFRRVVFRCLASDEAVERGLSPADAGVLLTRFRTKASLERDDRYQGWLRRRMFGEDELALCLRERDLEHQVHEAYQQLAARALTAAQLHRRIAASVAARTGLDATALSRPLRMRPGIPWEAPLVRELKLRGAFPAAIALARRILRATEEVAGRLPGLTEALSSERIEEYVSSLWGVERSAVHTAMLARGFSDYTELLTTARLAYAAERFGFVSEAKASAPGGLRSARTGRGVASKGTPYSYSDACVAAGL
jgi:hypothetical protein